MIKMTRSRAASAASLLVAMLLLAGCQAATDAPSGANLPPAQEQTKAVAAQAEWPVTRETYEEQYSEFAKCMKEAGVPLIGEELVGQVWQYSFPSEAEQIYNGCYTPFQPIDADWQIANEYESPTQQALRACLISAGIEPARDVDGVWKQLQAEGIKPQECN